MSELIWRRINPRYEHGPLILMCLHNIVCSEAALLLFGASICCVNRNEKDLGLNLTFSVHIPKRTNGMLVIVEKNMKSAELYAKQKKKGDEL